MEVLLASCTDGNGILGTDLHSGALVKTFENSAARPHSFGRVGHCSGYIFAAQAPKALLHVWTWEKKNPSYVASLPEKMTSMVYSSDAALCFAGGISGVIYVWQTSTGALLRSWTAHYKEITQLVVTPDDSLLVSASSDASVHVYSIADLFADALPRPLQTWSGHALPVTSIGLLPGSGICTAVVSAGLDRSVRIWDAATGQGLTSFSLAAPVNGLCVGAGGGEIFAACSNGELCALSMRGGSSEGTRRFIGHAGPVLGCAVNLDNSMLASCSAADRVMVWDSRTQQCLSRVHAHRDVSVGAVSIVQRMAAEHQLPAFQPLQRVVTDASSLPSVPVYTCGGATALEENMEDRAEGEADFVDRTALGAAEGIEAMAKCDLLRRDVEQVRASKKRWAGAAVELYKQLSDGVDAGASGIGPSIAPGKKLAKAENRAESAESPSPSKKRAKKRDKVTASSAIG